MKSCRNLPRCPLTVLVAILLTVPGLAQPPAARPDGAQASAPQQDARVRQRHEERFRTDKQAIRQAIIDRQFDLARRKVELTHRHIASVFRNIDHEHYRELMRELESFSRFIEIEERMSAAQRPGVPSRPEQAGSQGRQSVPREAMGRTAGAWRESESARGIRVSGETEPTSAIATGRQREHQARQRLRASVPVVDFPEGTGFEEVINWLRERSGLSVHVNWNVLALLGIDRTTDTLGMTLYHARFETVLRLLLDNVAPPEAPLDYDIVDGIVRISTREQLDRFRITRVYDVADLLVRIPSFRSTDDGLGMGGLMGGMGWGGAGWPGMGAGRPGWGIPGTRGAAGIGPAPRSGIR